MNQPGQHKPPQSDLSPAESDDTMDRVDAQVKGRLFGTTSSPAPSRVEIFQEGARIGKHIVLALIGAGGMGVVYAAYDNRLGRKVALKSVSPHAAGKPGLGQARLLREAAALAKLSHPNVVGVYDSGIDGEQVWIAMEFVEGRTLRVWASEQPRKWPEILRVLSDAARGVAAAHEAGLVHRDLKPDNVMISGDDRIRVMDFGLAHARELAKTEGEPAVTTSPDAEQGPESKSPAELTAKDSIVGTPAYMAPEQWQGHEAQAATDQFGWSVMAWEILYGERPFEGATDMALKAAVLSGRRKPPSRGRKVPGWLRKVIERGLSIEPAKRWPTMAALLAALERGKVRARIRTAVVVVASVALFGAGVEGYRRWDLAQRVAVCESAGADIDKTWNDDARKRLREAFAATGVTYAKATAERVLPGLDERAGAWKRARTDVCLNADVRKLWGEDLLDRAVWCLEDRRMEIDSLAAELGRANGTTVQNAVKAVSSLRTVETCLNEGMLQRQPALPAQGREALRDARSRLSRAQSLGLAGNFKDALSAATQTREQGEALLDWPPFLATVRALEGNLLERTGAYEKAEAVSTAAFFEAAISGTWDVAARAANDLIVSVGYRQARYADGHMWAKLADVALAHAGDRMGPWEAQRLNNLAVIHYATGTYADARALHERALAIREQMLGQGHPDVAMSLNNLANVHNATGMRMEAKALFERSLHVREQALGQDHPDVAQTLINLASVHVETGEYADAQILLERGLTIREQALGPGHPEVALALSNLAALHIATGDYAVARPLVERALIIQEKALGASHPAITSTLNNLAAVQGALGAHAEARALYERSLAIQEHALGPSHPEIATTLNNLANEHRIAGTYAEARTLLERTLAIREQALKPDAVKVAHSLHNLAEIHLLDNRPQDALPLLERTVAIFDSNEGMQRGELDAHFHLAKVLVATRGDLARALVEAMKARDGFREAGADQADELAEVEQWLTENEDKK